MPSPGRRACHSAAFRRARGGIRVRSGLPSRPHPKPRQSVVAVQIPRGAHTNRRLEGPRDSKAVRHTAARLQFVGSPAMGREVGWVVGVCRCD